jgi:hypothetical protein
MPGLFSKTIENPANTASKKTSWSCGTGTGACQELLPDAGAPGR